MLRRLFGPSRPRRRATHSSDAQRYVWSWTSVSELRGEAQGWRQLAEEALEPNPVYCPNFLIAAEKHLHGGRPIRALIARDRARGGALAALAPIQSSDWRVGMPGWITSLFCNPYTTLTHPLVRRDDAVEILTALVKFLAQERRRDGLLFPWLTESRPFFDALREAARRNGLELARIDGISRPSVDPETGKGGAQYAVNYCSKSRRSNVDRRLRRLQELGEVAFSEILLDEPGGRVALDAFLDLEFRSWKGAAGTALACKEATRNFAYDAFGGADIVSRVRVRALTLDGKPIAMALDLESQGVAYAFKAAYDEEYARFSPGLLLDAQTASRIGEDYDIKRLDSFAQTEIAQANVWRQEEPVGRYVLALSPEASTPALVRRVRRAGAARERVKQLVSTGRSAVSNGVRLARQSGWALATFAVLIAAPTLSMFLLRSW